MIEEGSARIHTEGTGGVKETNQADVFYNKVQVFNRDISLLAALTFMKTSASVKGKFRFLDALTASGLRAI